AQGAVPHRGQEDHGLRTRRATGLGIPRSRVLPDRGRSGIDWNVESVWRARKTGLGQTRETAQNDRRTVPGCAPVVRAFDHGEKVSQMWDNAATFAAGLRVPSLTAITSCLRS